MGVPHIQYKGRVIEAQSYKSDGGRLVINLKTAKALGLTIPQSIIVRADHLIE